ncbi:hypothetical protein Daus18300_008765 [Diaporthe australafricana]|uniref:Uncharacterized protein n=1 Tax=Diaporthe australafricana TaxID=127596 RepID=A0ABR3WH82_9PEZI
MTEAQKWRHVFLILFPDTDDQDVPSPYHEFKMASEHGSPENLMTDYENFLQRELPLRVRGQLERRIEAELIPIEDRLRGQIVEIVRDTQIELFRLFKLSAQNRKAPEESMQHDEVSHTDLSHPPRQDSDCESRSGQDHSVETNVTSEGWSLENHMQLPRPDPLLDWENFSGFDGQLYDFGEIDNGAELFPDSTYGAMPATNSFSETYPDTSSS